MFGWNDLDVWLFDFSVDFDCDVSLTFCLVDPCFDRPVSDILIYFDR